VSAAMHTNPRPTLIIIGGGIAGITAAVEASEAGCDVVLVEREPQLGGRVAQMYQYFPKLCPPMCGLEINLRRLRTSPHITVHTLSEVDSIDGRAGDLKVHIRTRTRFIGDACSACGTCAEVCPVERPSAFDLGMGKTRASFLAYPGAWPTRYTIDAAACLGPWCGKCVAACPCQAIDLTAQPRTFTVEASAIVWATGWAPYEPARLTDLGYGASKDIITNMMMERLASPHGPTEGRISCPSDGRAPTSVAFVQCAGSRDDAHLPYCSGLCCMASAKQVRYVRAQHPGADIFVYYIDRRATGRHESFLAETERDAKVHYIPGKVARISIEGAKPVLEVEDTAKAHKLKHPVDLVVLATGMVPGGALETLGRDGYGFLSREQALRGHLPAGSARGPMDVAASVRDATSAVLRAIGELRAGS
jgi:quinone-modifying oxidoreductase subunit QmoA